MTKFLARRRKLAEARVRRVTHLRRGHRSHRHLARDGATRRPRSRSSNRTFELQLEADRRDHPGMQDPAGCPTRRVQPEVQQRSPEVG